MVVPQKDSCFESIEWAECWRKDHQKVVVIVHPQLASAPSPLEDHESPPLCEAFEHQVLAPLFHHHEQENEVEEQNWEVVAWRSRCVAQRVKVR